MDGNVLTYTLSVAGLALLAASLPLYRKLLARVEVKLEERREPPVESLLQELLD